MSGLIIRDATLDDAADIARIYNEGIEDRATLETALRSADERRQWLAARGPRHPVIVAALDTGDMLGWASLNQFNPRAAYDHVADVGMRLYERCGFVSVGIYREQGMLDGKWVDVILMEKILD